MLGSRAGPFEAEGHLGWCGASQIVVIRRRTVDRSSAIQSWEPGTVTTSTCGSWRARTSDRWTPVSPPDRLAHGEGGAHALAERARRLRARCYPGMSAARVMGVSSVRDPTTRSAAERSWWAVRRLGTATTAPIDAARADSMPR